MEEKKKLKKLVLKKEEIVNLNDYQMMQLQGGSTSRIISKISQWTVDYTISETIDRVIDYTDGYLREHSVYTCAPQFSKEQYMGGCLLPEINVYP